MKMPNCRFHPLSFESFLVRWRFSRHQSCSVSVSSGTASVHLHLAFVACVCVRDLTFMVGAADISDDDVELSVRCCMRTCVDKWLLEPNRYREHHLSGQHLRCQIVDSIRCRLSAFRFDDVFHDTRVALDLFIRLLHLFMCISSLWFVYVCLIWHLWYVQQILAMTM